MTSWDCAYPDCSECTLADCRVNSIPALLKRRRRGQNPELYRQKAADYRKRIRESLPQCDRCGSCVLVAKEKQDGYRRLCVRKMRLIEQKVANCPQWCELRGGDPLHNDYIGRKRRERAARDSGAAT